MARIPSAIDKFYSYIINTDDCQKEIDPADDNKPVYLKWDWTPEESRQWTLFRNAYAELFSKNANTKIISDPAVVRELNRIIHACQGFDALNCLLDRIADSPNTNLKHQEVFNIQQDVLELKTSFRTIRLLYEKDRPFGDLEKSYVEKYVALHEEAHQALCKLKSHQDMIPDLHQGMSPLWEEFPEVRHKGLNLTPQIFFSQSGEVKTVQIPTEEESQRKLDDYYRHIQTFSEKLDKFNEQCDAAFEVVEWSEQLLDDDYPDPLFEAVKAMQTTMYENFKDYSINVVTIDMDYEEFLETYQSIYAENKRLGDQWDIFLKEHSLFIELYNEFVEYQNRKTGEGEDNDSSAGRVMDTEEQYAELADRFESSRKNNVSTYFDIDDWNQLIDYYLRKYDKNNSSLSIRLASMQHPGEGTFMIRKAEEEAAELRYQKALELLSLVESKGPPYHPGLYYAKACIYDNLKMPLQAVGLYKKAISASDESTSGLRRRAYDSLIASYEEQKNYEECIRLLKKRISSEPVNEILISEIGRFCCLSDKPQEAEELTLDFLKKHPKSAICLEGLGDIYTKMGLHQRAMENYDKAFEIDDESYFAVNFKKGDILKGLKRFGEGVVCYELGLLYNQFETAYHCQAAACYRELHRYEMAASHYRQALSTDPDSKIAMDGLQELKSNKLLSARQP
jgi:tetratricopeptide (TPR) repeat protein